MPRYRGSCHCGAVVFEIDAELTEFTKCDCSHCRKKNSVTLGVHESKFRILQGADNLGLYQWNRRIARHYFCKTCGIYPFHKRRTQPDHYAINVYCLDDTEAVDRVPIRMTDGKSLSVV